MKHEHVIAATPVSGCASLQFPIGLTFLMELTQAVLVEICICAAGRYLSSMAWGDRIHPYVGKVGDLRCLRNGLATA